MIVSRGIIPRHLRGSNFSKASAHFRKLALLRFPNGIAYLPHPYRTGVLNLPRLGATFTLPLHVAGPKVMNEGNLSKLSRQFRKETDLICNQAHIILINFILKS